MDDTTLTTKQLMFVEHYLGEARFNATQAARLAGYTGDNATLQSTGSANLRKPAIAARVRERIDEAMMSADECIAELSALARQPLYQTLTIKRNGRDEIVEARLDPMAKLRALELVGKRHGLFKDRLEISSGSEPVRQLMYLPPGTYDPAKFELAARVDKRAEAAEAEPEREPDQDD